MTASQAIKYLRSSGMSDNQIIEIMIAFGFKTLKHMKSSMMYDINMSDMKEGETIEQTTGKEA